MISKSDQRNTLWTFGCSFTDDLNRMTQEDLEFTNGKGSTFTEYETWKGYVPDSWPTLLAQKLGYNLQNQGRGSSSNDRIFSSFMESFPQIQTNDIIIIGWTHMARFLWSIQTRDTFYEMTDILPNSSTDHITKKTLNEILFNRTRTPWVDDLITKIDFIKFICEKSQINLYFWTSCKDTFDYLNKTNNLQNFITCSRDKNIFSYIYSGCNLGLKVTILDETNHKIDDSHLGEIGHKIKSQLFYEFIKSKE